MVIGLAPPRLSNRYRIPPLQMALAAAAPQHPQPPPPTPPVPAINAASPLPAAIAAPPVPLQPLVLPVTPAIAAAHAVATLHPPLPSPSPDEPFVAPVNQSNFPHDFPLAGPGQSFDDFFDAELAAGNDQGQAVDLEDYVSGFGVERNISDFGLEGHVSGLGPPEFSLMPALLVPAGAADGAPPPPLAPPAPAPGGFPRPNILGPDRMNGGGDGAYFPRTAAARNKFNNEWNWKDPGDVPSVHPDRRQVPFPTDADDNDATVPDEDRDLWTRAAHLGQGSFGSVQLWIKYDKDTNNVLDRVAIKHVSYKARPHLWVADHGLWFDGVGSRNVPAEVAAMRVLNNELNDESKSKSIEEPNDNSSDVLNDPRVCPLIIGYHGSRVYEDEKLTFRIAMPVSEFGDLARWISNKTTSLAAGARFPPLPPAFIFDFFAASLTAAKFMKNRNMLHNDVKLQNLLMFADDEDEESPMSEFDHEEGDGLGWGIHPVVTDFGLARPIDCRAIPNPRQLLHIGTRGYMPPEQIIDEPRQLRMEGKHSIVRGQDNEPVDEKAMVFSIAVMVFTLLHPQSTSIQPAFAPQPALPPAPVPPPENLYNTVRNNPGIYNGHKEDDLERIDAHFTARENIVAFWNGNKNDCYAPLKEILTDCLRFYPKERPSIDQTLAKLKESRPKYSQRQDFVDQFSRDPWTQFFPLGQQFDPVDLMDTRGYKSDGYDSDEEESGAP